MRIKTEEDELAKSEQTEAVSMEIINANSQCNDYTLSVEEQWVRTKRIEFTVIVCFHCAEGNGSPFIDTENENATELEFTIIVLAAAIVAISCLWIMGCLALWFKWKYQRG